MGAACAGLTVQGIINEGNRLERKKHTHAATESDRESDCTNKGGGGEGVVM